MLAVAAGSYKKKEPPAIRGTGYVVDCLEAALWAFHKHDTYEQAVLAAANLGDDADTTAAVCGQVAGAYYGLSGNPGRVDGTGRPARHHRRTRTRPAHAFQAI